MTADDDTDRGIDYGWLMLVLLIRDALLISNLAFLVLTALAFVAGGVSLFLNGFHPQGTSGAFVAAAAAGRLLGLDAVQMQHALGIA